MMPWVVNLNEDGVFARYRFRQPGTFVDVGANYGAFIGPAARRGTDVVAFEPHPELFAFLAKKYDGVQNVRIVQRAIADAVGMLPFYTSDEHPGIHSLAGFHATHKPTVQVEVSTLEAELRRMKVQLVSALKIDAEGADLLALRGFDFVEHSPELIMAEFMDTRSVEHFGYTHHDMADFMAGHGYESWVSEWAEIEEYGRAEEQPSHRWLGFGKYAPAGAPAWGNLICVRPEDRGRLQSAVRTTLCTTRARQAAMMVPGARGLRRLARRTVVCATSYGSRHNS